MAIRSFLAFGWEGSWKNNLAYLENIFIFVAEMKDTEF
jgi:hypothetical protein